MEEEKYKTREEIMQEDIDYLFEIEERRYNGWLVSPDLMKRVTAFLGYTILATLLFYAVLFIIFLFAFMLAAIIGGLASL